MRVIFMGTTPFSVVILNQLLEDGYDVVAVVTQPDRPFGRKRVLKASPVKVLALEKGIDVLQPEKIKLAVDEVLSYEPDLIVTCAYGQLVPKAILDAPKYLALNVHASLLPKYRGGAPMHWSIINGETETGVTLMRMDVGMDSGGMLSSRTVLIDDIDMMSDVEAKLMEVSKDLIHSDLPKYLKGDLKFIEQDPDKVSFAYTISREDELINFNQNVKVVYNHIRGLISWPVGYGVLEGSNVKFHGVSYEYVVHDFDTGVIAAVDESGVHIACRDGFVIISRIQPSGKPVIDAHDFMNGMGREWKGKRFL